MVSSDSNTAHSAKWAHGEDDQHILSKQPPSAKREGSEADVIKVLGVVEQNQSSRISSGESLVASLKNSRTARQRLVDRSKVLAHRPKHLTQHQVAGP